ncbi:MAG: dockerin type I repeat-containing protein [Planctomycetota bacterium]|nr:dockerin type I repeat-containing protein [Planctomycetota bacterium]
MKLYLLIPGLVVALLGSGITLAADDTVLFSGKAEGTAYSDPTVRIQPGGVAPYSFFYSDPSSNLQGFTITACFESPLMAVPGTFTIEGTVLEVVGAEYVNAQFDNDEFDGDGREMVIGILLDFLPPFAGQTAPPTYFPQEIGRFEFFAPEDVECFQCYPVQFCDNINGNGNVSLSNKVVIENESITPVDFNDGQVCVPAYALFIRGDVNNDGIVDVGDPIYLLNYLFINGPALPCPDASDADNDGLVNITDTVYLVFYVFGIGVAPPYPFPDCGLESFPDLDDLDCIVASPACPVCP